MASTPVFKINCDDQSIVCTKTDEGRFAFECSYGRVVFSTLERLNDVKFWRKLFEDEDVGFNTKDEIEDILFESKSYLIYKVLVFLQYHESIAYPNIKKPIVSANMIENLELEGRSPDFYNSYLQELGTNPKKLTAFTVDCLNSIDYEYLLNFICAYHASIIKNKTPREIREFFELPQLSEEEETELRADNKWIYDVKPVQAAPATAAPQ